MKRRKRKSAKELYRAAWRLIRMQENHYYIRNPYHMPFFWEAVATYNTRFDNFGGWLNPYRQSKFKVRMWVEYKHLMSYSETL